MAAIQPQKISREDPRSAFCPVHLRILNKFQLLAKLKKPETSFVKLVNILIDSP
jgi:hypothetical protein